jgi:hypothetical protein
MGEKMVDIIKCKTEKELNDLGWTKWGWINKITTGNKMSKDVSSYFFKSRDGKSLAVFDVQGNKDLKFARLYEEKRV